MPIYCDKKSVFRLFTRPSTLPEEKVKEKISAVLNNNDLKELARKCNFVQRSSSKIEGPDFVELLTTAIIGLRDVP